MDIKIPNNWRPRPYQMGAWAALERGVRRVCLIWHRRSGKDDLALHWTATEAVQYPGTYWHMLPKANQARKAIWDAVNPHSGKRRIDEAFPPAIRETTRDNEMLIRFKSGATWQLVGSDNYNALVGSPPRGVVFSEYALADPDAWAFLRPILAENGGWAIFVTTPRGRNHAEKLYRMAKGDPEWFGELLNVDDTKAIGMSIIDQERRELTAERGEREAKSIIEQEYYCSFDAAIPGSVYGPEVLRAEEEGRVLDLPYDERYPVTTAWDLGTADSTAIVFGQQVSEYIHLIDYFEATGGGPTYFAKAVNNDRPYAYKVHLFPHDGQQKHWSADGGTAVSVAKRSGILPVRVLPKTRIDDRIRAARSQFPKFKFDAKKCAPLLDVLRNYQYEYDDTTGAFGDKPKHDWTSHGADSFGYFAQGFRPIGYPMADRQQFAVAEYDIFG